MTFVGSNAKFGGVVDSNVTQRYHSVKNDCDVYK